MIYGIEESTDLRNPRTVIKKFSSENAARKWAARGGGFTYDDPEAARNYHHTFRRVYRMPMRWRMPSKSKIEYEWRRRQGSVYSPSMASIMASEVEKAGEELV